MSLKFDFDFEDALKREGIEKSDLTKLRDANIEGMPKIITDHQLLLFYSACNQELDETKATIESYYMHKRTVPEFFSKRDPTSEYVTHCLKNQIYFHLPCTPDNRCIMYARLSNPDASSFYFTTAVKTFFMSIDSCLSAQGPRPGIIFLLDAKDLSLSHIRKITIKAISTFCKYVQESLPAKLDEIHIINTSWFFDKILALVRPFLNKERKVYLHGYNSDYALMFKDKIPPECLPSDLGGTLESIEEMHNKHCERLIKMRNYFLEEEKQWKESLTKDK